MNLERRYPLTGMHAMNGSFASGVHMQISIDADARNEPVALPPGSISSLSKAAPRGSAHVKVKAKEKGGAPARAKASAQAKRR